LSARLGVLGVTDPSALHSRSRNAEKARISRPFLSGRYWVRTSDPQLVELVLSQLS
jgi:hypothetical protein